MSEPEIATGGTDATVRRRSGMLLVLGGVLIVVTVLVTLLLLGASWGLTVEYGTGTVGWSGGLLFASVPAVLIALCWAAVRMALGLAVGRWWVVLIGSWAVLALAVGVVTLMAQDRHEADAGTRASACSADEIDLLTGIPGYSSDFGTAAGHDNGACTITIPIRGDDASAVAVVVDAMSADGWSGVGWSGEPQFGANSVEMARSGTTVVVEASASDDKGWTDVQVILPGPPGLD